MMNFISGRGGEFEQVPPSECLINSHAQVTLAREQSSARAGQGKLGQARLYEKTEQLASCSSHPQMISLKWLLCWNESKPKKVRKKAATLVWTTLEHDQVGGREASLGLLLGDPSQSHIYFVPHEDTRAMLAWADCHRRRTRRQWLLYCFQVLLLLQLFSSHILMVVRDEVILAWLWPKTHQKGKSRRMASFPKSQPRNRIVTTQWKARESSANGRSSLKPPPALTMTCAKSGRRGHLRPPVGNKRGRLHAIARDGLFGNNFAAIGTCRMQGCALGNHLGNKRHMLHAWDEL